MTKFKVVNPLIFGSLNTTYEAKEPLEAAKQFWNSLTVEHNYISGNVPKFIFTLIDEDSKKLYHFEVREKPNENNEVDFCIKQLDEKIPKDTVNGFLNGVNKITDDMNTQMGGRRRKRYDDSSSDSDDFSLWKYYKRHSVKPISYWWYNPVLYNVDYVSSLIFTPPLQPYVTTWVKID